MLGVLPQHLDYVAVIAHVAALAVDRAPGASKQAHAIWGSLFFTGTPLAM